MLASGLRSPGFDFWTGPDMTRRQRKRNREIQKEEDVEDKAILRSEFYKVLKGQTKIKEEEWMNSYVA